MMKFSSSFSHSPLKIVLKQLFTSGSVNIGLFQIKSTPQRMARWKFSREGGSKALEILAGRGVWT